MGGAGIPYLKSAAFRCHAEPEAEVFGACSSSVRYCSTYTGWCHLGDGLKHTIAGVLAIPRGTP